LSGNALAGSGSLSNTGLLDGRGAVTVAASNAGGLIHANAGGTLLFTQLKDNRDNGSIVVDGGSTLRLDAQLNNLGVVTLNGGTVSGGRIFNIGRIEGSGSIQNRVDNNVSGRIEIGAGATLRFSNLGDNAGLIAIDGGRLDNGTGLLVNAAGGVIGITGNSSIASQSLRNDGRFTATGATFVLSGGLVNNGSTTLDNSTVQFRGAVNNAGTLQSSHSAVTFLAGFNNSGVYITDPNLTVTTDLVNTGSAAIIAAAGDRFQVSGSVLGDTTNHAVWNTDGATLEFSANGGGAHVIELSGVDLGAARSGAAHNFAWGDLRLDAGQSLTLADASANWSAGRGALYVGGLELAGLAPGADLGDAIAARFSGNGFNVYYDPLIADNAYLGGKSWSFGSEGGALIALAPVPEPGAWALWAAGLVLVPVCHARRRAGRTSGQPLAGA
jgi:hypothetical protein